MSVIALQYREIEIFSSLLPVCFRRRQVVLFPLTCSTAIRIILFVGQHLVCNQALF